MSESRNGHINWGPWIFDYNVADTEGLCLLNVYLRGHKVIAKFSLPVIRVKYIRDSHGIFSGGCGPYKDLIRWDTSVGIQDLWGRPHHLVKISDCGHRYICVRSFKKDGMDWLELGVYMRIGAYHLYQCYYLSASGMVLPRVFSKGLSCNIDHTHHPYWRFDFDLDGAGHQRVNLVTDQFSGFYNREGSDRKSNYVNPRWNVENLKTGARGWVWPQAHDGQADGWSNLDVNIRKYRPAEDTVWPFGTGELHYAVHENPDDSDVLLWYVAHLVHHASEGKHPWHDTGPNITFDLPRQDPPPGTRREIQVDATFNITDPVVIGHDRTGRFTLSGKTVIDGIARHGEVVLKSPVVGNESRVVLRVGRDWNSDLSVGVDFDAKLFDGGGVDRTAANHFSVLRDHWQGWWVNLKSAEWPAPDRAHIDFTVTNRPG